MSPVWERWEEAISSEAADPLEVITLAGMYHRYLAAVEERAVKTARQRGATWQDIADAAGTTRQSAWEKWKAVQRLAEAEPDRFTREVLDVERRAQVETTAWLRDRARRRRAGGAA